MVSGGTTLAWQPRRHSQEHVPSTECWARVRVTLAVRPRNHGCSGSIACLGFTPTCSGIAIFVSRPQHRDRYRRQSENIGVTIMPSLSTKKTLFNKKNTIWWTTFSNLRATMAGNYYTILWFYFVIFVGCLYRIQSLKRPDRRKDSSLICFHKRKSKIWTDLTNTKEMKRSCKKVSSISWNRVGLGKAFSFISHWRLRGFSAGNSSLELTSCLSLYSKW